MIAATVLLSVACCLIPRLHRRSAAERHLFWTASLGAAALLPFLSLLLPAWQPEWARGVMAAFPSPFDAAPSWTVGPDADIVICEVDNGAPRSSRKMTVMAAGAIDEFANAMPVWNPPVLSYGRMRLGEPSALAAAPPAQRG